MLVNGKIIPVSVTDSSNTTNTASNPMQIYIQPQITQTQQFSNAQPQNNIQVLPAPAGQVIVTGQLQPSVTKPQLRPIATPQPRPIAPAISVAPTMLNKVTNVATAAPSSATTPSRKEPLDKKRLNQLVKETDPTQQLEDDVEAALLQIADDFITSTVKSSCLLAKHRKATEVEVKDVQLYLEQNWNMYIPGFASDEVKTVRKGPATEAHRHRLNVIRKTLKK